MFFDFKRGNVKTHELYSNSDKTKILNFKYKIMKIALFVLKYLFLYFCLKCEKSHLFTNIRKERNIKSKNM